MTTWPSNHWPPVQFLISKGGWQNLQRGLCWVRCVRCPKHYAQQVVLLTFSDWFWLGYLCPYVCCLPSSWSWTPDSWRSGCILPSGSTAPPPAPAPSCTRLLPNRPTSSNPHRTPNPKLCRSSTHPHSPDGIWAEDFRPPFPFYIGTTRPWSLFLKHFS